MHAADICGLPRSDRILVEKLRLLYRGNFAVPANFAIACLVAYLLRDTFPEAVLIGWLTATAAAVLGRMLLYRRFLQAVADGMCSKCWARMFCIGALASGLLWGAICIGLIFWGLDDQYVMLTLAISGICAAALTTIVTYLPAYYAYAVPLASAQAMVLLLHPNPRIAATGWLMLLFLAIVCFAARNLSKSAIRSIELKIDNQILNESLKAALSERDKARGEKWSTLAQLSHELRTPLNAIIGFSELTHSQAFGPIGNVRYSEYAELIQRAGRHLLSLINDILDMSKIEAGKFDLQHQSLDIREVIRECLDLMAERARDRAVALVEDMQNAQLWVDADHRALKQILLNLLSNAIKFTPRDGTVTVGARYAQDRLVLWVQDTGVGIPPDQLSRLGNPFVQIRSSAGASHEGTGLGLALVRALVELHRGTLKIESTPGRGTTVSVIMPIAQHGLETSPGLTQAG